MAVKAGPHTVVAAYVKTTPTVKTEADRTPYYGGSGMGNQGGVNAQPMPYEDLHHSLNLTLQHLAETARPEDPGRAGEFDRALGLMRGEIRRLDALVGNFLRFARSERRALAPVDFAELLRETARLVEREAERRRVRVELEVEDGLPAVTGDAESIRASVLNLVLNSLDAIEGEGRVVLRARQREGAVTVERREGQEAFGV